MFDETSGTIAYDKSGYNRNGSIVNGPVSTTTSYGERVLKFDGSDDYIALPNDIVQIIIIRSQGVTYSA